MFNTRLMLEEACQFTPSFIILHGLKSKKNIILQSSNWGKIFAFNF